MRTATLLSTVSDMGQDIDVTCMAVTVLLSDSVTKLPPEADGAVVVGGSHGAVYAAHLTARAGVRAAIHDDGGIGLDEAGVSGLPYAEKLGMAMLALATRAAVRRAQDQYARGIVSRPTPRPSRAASRSACRAGTPPSGSRRRRGRTRHRPPSRSCAISKARSSVSIQPHCWCRKIATACSPPAAMPALIAGHTTAHFRPRLILFNDGGPGIDRGGVLGLDVLDQAGVAGAAVAARSARIGDGRSTLQRRNSVCR